MKLWNKLKDIYEPQGTVTKHYLLKEFYNLRYNEGTGILQDYINKLTQISQQLAKLGEPQSDLNYIIALLNSLLNNYNNIVLILEAQLNLILLLLSINY